MNKQPVLMLARMSVRNEFTKRSDLHLHVHHFWHALSFRHPCGGREPWLEILRSYQPMEIQTIRDLVKYFKAT